MYHLRLLQTKYTPSVLFSDGSSIFQQDNAPTTEQKMLLEWFEEHDKEFKVLPRPPNCPDLNRTEDLCDELDQKTDPQRPQFAALEGSAASVLGFI